MKPIKSLLVLALGLASILLFSARPAQAACGGLCCTCDTIRNYIITEIDKHQEWLEDDFWKNYFEPALSTMANQINAGLTEQTTKIGSFVEAQNNIEKRRVLQELSAETAGSYSPSEQLCRYGSLSQSLASTEEKARANRMFLMSRSESRQLGEPNTASTDGPDSDIKNRMKIQLTRFCDKSGNGGQNKTMCLTDGNDKFLNADINFAKTFDAKPTLNIDFTSSSGAPTDDEQNIMALADNLFASDLFPRPAVGALSGTGAVEDARLAVMDMRALIAKRSVAENSFNTLVGLKSKGSGTSSSGATKFVAGVLKELGLDNKSALSYLGEAPSYDAQMEVLTKKIYQTPNFYINLMENPANVERQYAAMQSFGLMQQRDIFDSILRSEMLLSMIVELEVAKYQDQAQAMMDR